MGELRLTLGTATAYPGGAVVIGGDGSVDDDSDASYVRYALTPYVPESFNYYWHPAAAAVPDFSATGQRGLRFRVRSELLAATTPTDLRRFVIVDATTFAIWFSHYYLPPASPGWSDLGEYELTESQWVKFQTGGLVSVESVSSSAFAANFYQIEMSLFWTSKSAPPLRRYPRAGATGPTRQWPRRITRRPGTY